MSSLYADWVASPKPKPHWPPYKARREAGASHGEAIVTKGKGRKSPWPHASSHVMVSVPPAIKAWLLANPAKALALATR